MGFCRGHRSAWLIPVPGTAHYQDSRATALIFLAHLCLWDSFSYILPCGDQYRHDHRYRALHRHTFTIDQLWRFLITEFHYYALRPDQARFKPHGNDLSVAVAG